MADKANFTKDEWALLLRSPMNAGMAVTAAEPSGLWGLLKESFAGSAELAHAAADPNANPLIKSVVADFMTGDGRAVARDGLKAEFANSQPAGDQDQGDRLAASSCSCSCRESAGRRRGLQDLAAPDRSEDRRGGIRGRKLVWWRGSSQRC